MESYRDFWKQQQRHHQYEQLNEQFLNHGELTLAQQHKRKAIAKLLKKQQST